MTRTIVHGPRSLFAADDPAGAGGFIRTKGLRLAPDKSLRKGLTCPS